MYLLAYVPESQISGTYITYLFRHYSIVKVCADFWRPDNVSPEKKDNNLKSIFPPLRAPITIEPKKIFYAVLIVRF